LLVLVETIQTFSKRHHHNSLVLLDYQTIVITNIIKTIVITCIVDILLVITCIQVLILNHIAVV